MPGDDYEGSRRPSRRVVLRGAAGAGAAGVAATALSGLGGTAFAAGARPSRERPDDDTRSPRRAGENAEQFVVHVRDARTGQIDVFRGSSHVRLHDRDLAAVLERVSRS